jgi:hypothetical protein
MLILYKGAKRTETVSVLPSNFCLKGSAEQRLSALEVLTEHPVGRAKVDDALHTNPSLAPQ